MSEFYYCTDITDIVKISNILLKKYPKNNINISFINGLYCIESLLDNLVKTEITISIPINVNIEVIYGDTDSCFLKFTTNFKTDIENSFDNEKISAYNYNRQITYTLANLCGDKLTKDIFKRPPIELEYEKIFQPFVLLTKKRYIGAKYENPFILSKIDYKGIALTRRDYALITKKCYQELIDILMKSNDDSSLEIVKEIYKSYIDKLYNHSVNIDDLMLSSQIAKDYSCKLCKEKTCWILKCSNCNTVNYKKKETCQKCNKTFACLHSFSLTQINLAQKMLSRNEDIQINDRIAYLYYETMESLCKSSKIPKNELGETRDYISEHNLNYNRLYYIEQLAKTILSFLKISFSRSHQDDFKKLIEYTNYKIVLLNGVKLKESDFKELDE
jgi:hypothetical protein